MLQYLVLCTIFQLTISFELDPFIDANNNFNKVPAISNEGYGGRANFLRYASKDIGISSNNNRQHNDYGYVDTRRVNDEPFLKTATKPYGAIEKLIKNESATATLLQEKEVKISQNELTDVLNKLTSILDKINQNMIQDSSNGYFYVKIPIQNQERRDKRAINNSTLVNVTVLSEVINETDIVENVDSEKNGNLNSGNEAVANDTLSGRRSMMNHFAHLKPTVSDMKTKLLAYLEDSFAEIEKKVQPLNHVKILLSDENNYKIGYITANIDTLAVNLKKLRQDMHANKHVWSDSKILELFDKLKKSNRIISNLLESLSLSLPKQYSTAQINV